MSFFMSFIAVGLILLVVVLGGIAGRLRTAVWPIALASSTSFVRTRIVAPTPSLRANTKKFAYDICHTWMMEYLLRHPDLATGPEGRCMAMSDERRPTP